MYKKSLTINLKNGIHTRIAAIIVHKADEIKHKYNTPICIRKKNGVDALEISMLALISLKVQQHETVEIICNSNSPYAKTAVLELYNFISNDLENNNSSMTKIDNILEENIIANEQIIKNLPTGVIVIDTNSNITTINDYALNLISKNFDEVLGKYINTIIPASILPEILATRKNHHGEIEHINKHIVITNRAPIVSNGKLIGAVGIYQDISELVGMKELNEKFKKILEASSDLICFINENRKISYINPAYEKCFNINAEELQGKDLNDVSPKGLRMKVYNTQKKVKNLVYHKNKIDVVANIEPIFIDSNFKGVISILKPANEIRLLIEKLNKSEEELAYYKQELKRHTELSSSFSNIIGHSNSLKDCLLIAEKASNSTSTVLIRGESGTGKELIAKAIHNSSSRNDKPFVRINCAAIPENLLESELFGYEKGAFTGAIKSKPGKFNIANGGTVFLDEIGDMPVQMQVKLLRVLQEKEFESVGGIKTHKVDIRIIAATNKNLEKMIKADKFREDLYYRLNVLSIFLPPLRDRKEDINLLTEHFLKKINEKLKKNISNIESTALKYLQNYHWPGNIRELENIIERAINICDNDVISSKDLPFYITKFESENKNLINLKNENILPLEEYEKEIITLAMKKYKSYNKAGKALGLTHRTVSLKCKKYGIKP